MELTPFCFSNQLILQVFSILFNDTRLYGSKEEKMKYVHLHLEEHMSLKQIEKEYGIGNALAGAWVKKYLEDGEDALEPHNGNPYAALHRSRSLTEVERLRLLVAKQEVEIARLTHANFAPCAGKYCTSHVGVTNLATRPPPAGAAFPSRIAGRRVGC